MSAEQIREIFDDVLTREYARMSNNEENYFDVFLAIGQYIGIIPEHDEV